MLWNKTKQTDLWITFGNLWWDHPWTSIDPSQVCSFDSRTVGDCSRTWSDSCLLTFCSSLSLQFIRMAHPLLDRWKDRLDARKKRLLVDYFSRTTLYGLYPEVWMSPDLESCFVPSVPMTWLFTVQTGGPCRLTVWGSWTGPSCSTIFRLKNWEEERVDRIGEFFIKLP